MVKAARRTLKVSGTKIPSGDDIGNSKDTPAPTHLSSAFLIAEPSCFITHRVGPTKELEKLYGPYTDKQKARSRLSEHLENFIRENSIYNPAVHFHRDRLYAKVEVEGMQPKGEGPAKHSFYFSVKSVSQD